MLDACVPCCMLFNPSAPTLVQVTAVMVGVNGKNQCAAGGGHISHSQQCLMLKGLMGAAALSWIKVGDNRPPKSLMILLQRPVNFYLIFLGRWEGQQHLFRRGHLVSMHHDFYFFSNDSVFVIEPVNRLKIVHCVLQSFCDVLSGVGAFLSLSFILQ